MGVELAEIAAGLPMAASLAVASGITSLREGRRRTVLNEALHELRRPLQVLALSLTADSSKADARESSLKMTTAALERLDREINGGSCRRAPRPVEIRAMIEAAVARWRTPAGFHGKCLRLRWRAADPLVHGDEFELAQAVDNLISNSIEHGGVEVTIEVREAGDRLRLAVIDSGAPSSAGRGGRRHLQRVGGRQRHGHGLRVVARSVAKCGGSFQLRRLRHRTEARLELPLWTSEGQR